MRAHMYCGVCLSVCKYEMGTCVIYVMHTICVDVQTNNMLI